MSFFFFIFREYKCTEIDSIVTIQIKRQAKRSGPSCALSALSSLSELFLVFVSWIFQQMQANTYAYLYPYLHLCT